MFFHHLYAIIIKITKVNTFHSMCNVHYVLKCLTNNRTFSKYSHFLDVPVFKKPTTAKDILLHCYTADFLTILKKTSGSSSVHELVACGSEGIIKVFF